MDRAIEFYSKVFEIQLQKMDFGGFKMAGFPSDGKSTGGALCQGNFYNPTPDGVLIYLNGGEDLSIPLSKVESAGGKIMTAKKQITPEIGFMAQFIDSEGNKIALHSQH